MRTIVSLLLFACVGATSFGQGTVLFSTCPFAPATNTVTGQPIPAGIEWSAQLFYGPAGSSESQLIPFTNAPAHFAVAGYIFQSTAYYTDPGVVNGGAFAAVQVRIWSSILGNDWNSAYGSWLSLGYDVWRHGVAKSNVGLIQTGNPNAAPPGLPASLRGGNPGEIGLRPFSFTPIPEPSVLALALGGALFFLWHRPR